MKKDLVEHLCCPTCRADLALEVETEQAGGVETGSLGCDSCGRSYPILRGVPRFVQSDGYVKSFSYEWNRWTCNSTSTAVRGHVHRLASDPKTSGQAGTRRRRTMLRIADGCPCRVRGHVHRKDWPQTQRRAGQAGTRRRLRCGTFPRCRDSVGWTSHRHRLLLCRGGGADDLGSAA